MADTPRSQTANPAPRNGNGGDAKPADGPRRPPEEAAIGAAQDAGQSTAQAGAQAGAQAADAVQRQAQDNLRAAEAALQNGARASEDVARANSEVLKAQLGAAEQLVRAGMETSVQSIERLAQAFSSTFGLTANPEFADRSADNLRVVSQASTALARGAQETTRAWMDLAQKGFRTNLDAFGQLTRARSVTEVVAVQTNQARDNIQHFVDSGELIARASSQAIDNAAQAIRGAAQQPRA